MSNPMTIVLMTVDGTRTSETQWVTTRLGWREFLRSELAEPGVMVRFNDGSTMLIGESNTQGGVCDDCPAAHYDAIVVALIDLRAIITEITGAVP